MQKLFSTTRGAGDPPFTLIHGWTCDHGAMLPVAEAFPDHSSTLVDLPGHGKSPKASDYSIEAQAAAALAVAPPRSVWIGHSMGAQVSIAAAVAAPERVAGLVLLDPAFIAPHDKARAFGQSVTKQLDRFDIPSMMEAFARGQFIKASDPAAVERLVATMRGTDPAVTRAAWDAVVAWDGRTAIARVTCPSLMIVVDKPLNRPADVARLNENLMTGQVAGSGHMVQFEVMEQVAAMMRRFLEINLLVSER
jgi:pimeloyl-[acyl-carrier protein] methyl ester esterase